MKRSKGEAALALHLRAEKIDGWKPEYQFHPERRWRFDFAWPEKKLAVEVEGGGWNQGRHNRGAGFHADMIKYDEAMRLGWNVYRCSTDMAVSGRAIETIKILLGRIE